MKTFRHYNAQTLRQAVSLISKYNGKAKANAGGTELLGSLRGNCAADYPEALVNIKTIPDLDYIKAGRRGLRIGALARLDEIAGSTEIRKSYALLAEAAQSVATPNLRNMATLGGNLAQDVRCWYYRYPQQIGGPITCLRKGGKICSALVGDNRYHSIYGAAAASERRCASHCPSHIDIPGYLRLIRENNIAAAARTLLASNPFPAITGRVCPIFCEPHCNRSEYDDPVSIHSIERGVGDYILEHADDYFSPPGSESGKKVSIIGSGPAGLTAAYYLRKSGHRVSVYDRMPQPGGMLRYSIPPFRLPREIVAAQLKALENMGIEFQTSVTLDRDLAEAITADSDAVFIASGTWRSLELKVPGESVPGVYGALAYLKKINSGEKVSLGKKVAVIGGGSVAIDAARTARRAGTEEVHVVCLETRNLASKDRMPALDQEILEAEEEGIIIHPSLGVLEIHAANGGVSGIRTRKCISVLTADDRFDPRFDDTAPSPDISCEGVIVAIGQAAEDSVFVAGEKVFIGGDMAEGPSTVIQAIASAKKGVNDIETFLGIAKQPEVNEDLPSGYSISHFDSIPRVKTRQFPAAERVKSMFLEDVSGLTGSEVQKEACRCVSCGCLAVGPSDIAVALVALNATIVTTRRTLPAQTFFTATASSSTVLEPDELIKEVKIPKPPSGAHQRYLKFTLRKPVDFAIVSVASVIMAKNGICSDARIALGAVAPAPMRLKEAEAVIKGKSVNEENAAMVAQAALESAQSLTMNQYKVDIARVLIKRSILGMPE